MEPFEALMIAVALVYGGYEIYTGFRNYRDSGFRFYWIAGLLVGAPFFFLVMLFLLRQSYESRLLEGALLVIWLGGTVWKIWQQNKARREAPRQWESWQRFLRRKN